MHQGKQWFIPRAWYGRTAKKPAIRRRAILEMKIRLNPGFVLKNEQVFKRNEYDRDQQRWREIHGFEIPYTQNV